MRILIRYFSGRSRPTSSRHADPRYPTKAVERTPDRLR